MEEIFKQWTFYLAAGVEAIAGIIIAIAVIEAAVRAFLLFFKQGDKPESAKDDVRLRLGRWLAVALEFELAADILRTAIAPTWSEIGQLAAIIVLRTVLNYFLQKEIEKTAIHQGTSTENVGKISKDRKFPFISGRNAYEDGTERSAKRGQALEG
ncbi:MAG TPA: DUF1622 domain-containing protein [Chloroflexia bacterium]|nr:DUF1622 domain-containing protein [Chloroflexia bacterium]